jgi:hypothetical protein
MNVAKFAAALVLAVGCVRHTPVVVPPPAAPAPPPERPKDPVEVVVWRDLEVTLHGDTEFEQPQKEAMTHAAANIRRLTHDRARITVVFDVDFGSPINLREHARHADNVVLGVHSWAPVVAALEKSSGSAPDSLVAAMAPMNNGARFVFFILDRIPGDRFLSVATHEFGHVIGLPDLPEMGSIMSGKAYRGTPDPPDWTPDDIALCRRFHFCE